MAQGEGASLFVRLHSLTGDERYAEAAIRALRPMQVPSPRAACAPSSTAGSSPRSTRAIPPPTSSTAPSSRSGAAATSRSRSATSRRARLYDEGIDTLAANIDRFDSGYWSIYDLFPHPIRNIASGAYHQLHLTQLRAQQVIGPRPEFAAAIERWEGYQASGRCRRKATAEKIAFRLVVPRNDTLALRLPWSHRPEHGELLVLCYHAVSDEWPSRLAVTTGDFRRQLSSLVDRGYRGVTFTDAVTGPADGKRLAVTFDDGYATLATKALPILAELGLVATVFMPTRFPDSGEPMSWPGIEDWLGTEHEPELEPLGWDGLRTLSDAGWEIGSHTVSHPRLTRIDDERLAAELAESKAELERRLERPCRSLAYPYGDVDERVIAAARDAGYVAGAELPDRFEFPRLLAGRGSGSTAPTTPSASRPRSHGRRDGFAARRPGPPCGWSHVRAAGARRRLRTGRRSATSRPDRGVREHGPPAADPVTSIGRTWQRARTSHPAI